MPTNADAAALFRSIADVLDVLGERFKPEAYRRAARSIESLTEGLAQVAARDELRSIPGVGDAIEEKIREYLRTGRVEYYERLQKEVPPGILSLLRIPGLGPKTARRFWLELGVEGPGELADAIGKGRLAGVKGFGPKKVEQIRLALAAAEGRPSETRLPIEVAYPIAAHLVAGLRAAAGTQEIEVAGSFRRCRETVGDLDILVTSGDPEQVFDTFSHLPEVAEVRLRGGTKETVILTQGLQVDLRVVEPAAFGAALLYFTGSKDHNVRLRSLARDRGLKINEYGVFRGEERVGGRTEQEIYSALDLAWIPPEIREDRGEIEAAAKGPLPALVERTDLHGDLHCHLAPDASERDVDTLVASARRRGLSYVGCVVGGVGADGVEFSVSAAVLARLGTAGGRDLVVGRAVEVEGSVDPRQWARGQPDLVIVRPTATTPAPPAGRSDAPPAALVTHVGGEEPAREWIAYARRVGAAMEVGPGPDRLDSTAARSARESGVPLLVPTGVDRPDNDPLAAVALGFARRAGAGAREVRNAAPAAKVTEGWSEKQGG
jgi:DNA polymerase/3'-5' exonuclease PolX